MLGLTMGELQAQSGHATAQILLRYVNARAGDVARETGVDGAGLVAVPRPAAQAEVCVRTPGK